MTAIATHMTPRLPRSLRGACRRRRLARGFMDACVATLILTGVGAILTYCV